jgi:uncharacterized protein (TIGR02117 family)
LSNEFSVNWIKLLLVFNVEGTNNLAAGSDLGYIDKEYVKPRKGSTILLHNYSNLFILYFIKILRLIFFMKLILPILFCCLDFIPQPITSIYNYRPGSDKVIYLVKISWHTGIVFKTDEVDTSIWKQVTEFKNFNYVDVGWGDKDFYQHPGFNLDLAARALFTKTGSTLRAAGFNGPIINYMNSTDCAEKITLTKKEYDKLCDYIELAYNLDNGKPVELSEQFSGAVKFYKAKGYYTIFNTCNTWVAEALKFSGFKIDDNIILSQQLFRETAKFGTMVKLPQ